MIEIVAKAEARVESPFVQTADDAEYQLIQTAHKAANAGNWVIGECASRWFHGYAKGRTDAAFAEMIEQGEDKVFQCRRVWEKFGQIYSGFKHLTWSHFRAALQWDDAPEFLAWAEDCEATVKEMILYRASQQGKLKENAYDGAPLHFIGHLQRNKVKQVVGYVNLIQSVGSLELLEEIERVAAGKNLVQDILLEVNIGEEPVKSGFLPDAVLSGAEEALSRRHVRVRGLMTIPPANVSREENMKYFEKVRTLYVDINGKLFNNNLEYLSMGMSRDFADAARCGATMVRVGSAIFGARNYNL